MEHSNAAGSEGPTQRDLWRQARQHIHEYESKAAELDLDKQQHAKALQRLNSELAQVKSDAEAARSSTQSIRQQHMELQRKELDMQRKSHEALNDIRALNDQQQLAQKRLLQLQTERQAMGAEFAAHLAEQQQILDQFQQQCSSSNSSQAVLN